MSDAKNFFTRVGQPGQRTGQRTVRVVRVCFARGDRRPSRLWALLPPQPFRGWREGGAQGLGRGAVPGVCEKKRNMSFFLHSGVCKFFRDGISAPESFWIFFLGSEFGLQSSPQSLSLAISR